MLNSECSSFDFSHEYSLWQDLSMHNHHFYPVTLPWCLVYFLKKKKLTSLLTFPQWVPEFCFHISHSWIKSFLLVLNLLTLSFDIFLIKIMFFYINIIHTSDKIRISILHMSISCDQIFVLVSRYLSLWPWSLSGAFCVSQTHLVSFS